MISASDIHRLVLGHFTRPATEALAGHQIALTTVSTTFMMPLGISSAAAVRVGILGHAHRLSMISRPLPSLSRAFLRQYPNDRPPLPT